MGLDDLTSDQLRVESVPRSMRGEMQVYVGNAVTEHIDVDHLGTGGLAECARGPGKDAPERPCFLAVEVGDVRNVPLRLEVRESSDLALVRDGESPKIVLPDLRDAEFGVGTSTPAEHALGAAFVHTARESALRQSSFEMDHERGPLRNRREGRAR